MSLIRAKQRIGRIPDDAQVFALHAGELGSQQQLRHADDGIHRRADFVGHVGQKAALGAAGGFGSGHRPLLRGLHLFALRDVAGHAEDGRLPLVLDWRRSKVDPEGTAVFIDELDFVPRRDGFASLPGEAPLLDQLAEVRMNVLQKTHPHEFVARVAQHDGARGIDVGVSRPLIDGDGRRQGLGHRAEALLAGAERLFGLLPPGDVVEEYDASEDLPVGTFDGPARDVQNDARGRGRTPHHDLDIIDRFAAQARTNGNSSVGKGVVPSGRKIA